MGYAQPKRQGCKQRSEQLKQSCLFCLKRVCVVLSIMRLGVISAEPTLSIHKCYLIAAVVTTGLIIPRNDAYMGCEILSITKGLTEGFKI